MRNVKIAILGMGTVGSGIYRLIEREKKNIEHKEGISLDVAKVLAKAYSIDIPEEKKAADIEEVVSDPEIQIVAEVMGGIHPAKEFILKALLAGKTVVSANKELIAQHWPELEKAAKKSGAGFYFEASVGGGIPILRAIGDSLQANSIESVYGIINGTTNYILSKMADEGREFEDVLKEAQDLGYAEANPTSDVDGFDSMYKLSILASMAFHARVPVEYIYREGISAITREDIEVGRELGYEVKLLAIGKREGNSIQMRVHPTMIPKDHPLASIKGSFNSIYINGSAVGEMMFYGRGAGDLPTASALVSDMIYSLNACRHKYSTFYNEDTLSSEITIENNWETKVFIRINVHDRPGVLASIASILGNNNVSLESVLQKGKGKNCVPLILVTHVAHEEAIRKAIAEIEELPDVMKVASCIRVEE
jgi:homoserine dehydrogenase